MRAAKGSLRSHKLACLSTASSRHLRSLFRRSQPLPLIHRGSGHHHHRRLRASLRMCTLRVVTMILLSIVQMRVVTIDGTHRCFTLFSFVSGAITPKRINLLAVTSSRKLWTVTQHFGSCVTIETSVTIHTN